MTIKELCAGLTPHIRSRIVNCLHEQHVDTIDDLREFLNGEPVSVLDGWAPGMGRKCIRVLDQLVGARL